jgi:hypothetical protein
MNDPSSPNSPDKKKQPPLSTLDLDFDGVKGEKKTAAKKDEDVLNGEEKKEKKKAKKAGIQLSVPNNGGWINKDITECTGEEFLAWAKGVYPRVTADPSRFDDPKKRAEAFKKILRYHKQFLTPEQRETKH